MDLYMMNCELLATCSALGYLEGDTYHREPDCLESVKDLIRYLRHEDDTRDIRQQLGAGQILQNDLLPIITQHSQDKPLFDACIRLMVNITQPALLCFGKVPDDPAFRHHFLQLMSYLQAYKEAFASEKVFGVLSETLYNLLQLDWEQRQEEDNLLIERILLLVRNVLHVPADPYEEKNVDDDASVHDKLLWAIHMSGFDDLIKFLASAQSEQQWSMHVLEVISLMFRDQTPELLVSAGHARSVQEKQNDAQELELLRQKEQAEKRSRTLQRGTRHSRFGGSYVVQGLKSIGDNDVIYHRGLHNFKNYTHDSGKAVRRVPKRKQHARDSETKRRSALNVRLFLREFCIDFLENCYNRLMYLVKEGLIREQAQQHDETYYLWALSFFMAFNRGNGFHADLVSETMSIRAFHFIERNITNYYEMMVTDRKEATTWSRRMHLALKAYQELLLTVNEMDRSPDENIRHSANVIKSNIFYLMEYREIFLTLLRKFDETKQPRSFLKDLVESTHLFLRMLERFCKGRNNLVVQKKRVKRRKRRGQKHPSAAETTPEALQETWSLVAEELRVTGFQLSEALTEGVVPFDAASETPMEEQRTEAMVRVQDALLARLGPEALGLLRAAREVWPEGDVFGSTDVEPEEELELLKQILFANLPRPPPPELGMEEDGAAELEEVEEELEAVQVSETDFNFLDFIKRFAHSNIVRPYVLLLKSYTQNTPHTNHCITRMLHRLAVDLKMEALLFQLSVFCVFNKILSDPAAAAYKELVTFAKFVLNRFFALAARNDKAYVELLFWKNVGAVRDMTEGYSKDRDESNNKATWTQEEEEELRSLYETHRDSGVPDIVETLLPLLSNSNRTRRQVVVQMVQMGLVDSAKDLKKQKKGTRIVLWTEQQEQELQMLFEEYRDSDDVLGNILKKLTAKRSRARLVEKLLSLGLVSDRRELYKKRRRNTVSGKSCGKAMTEEEFLADLTGDLPQEPMDEEEEEDEEEEDEESQEEGEENGREMSRNGGRQSKVSTLEKNDSVDTAVRALRQEGMSGPLLWLQNCLNRAADDREEEGLSQPVPLVPLMEETEDAMEKKSFQRLLRKLGVRAPADEQESFWRIPAKLSSPQLRRAAAALCLSREAPEEASQPENPIEEHQEETDSHEQRAQALRALLLARRRKHPSAEHTDFPSVEHIDSESASQRSPQENTSIKRSRVLDSEEEKDEGSLSMNEPESSEEAAADSNRPTKRRRRRVLIDDDEEDEN
ncbi:protein timeless homolog [Osmerus eperlanus]|uniref:protein timeless homolog n=1 Tax=Osmerus eperlanus TaxID=29151 RepID=UPI002E107EE1